MPGRMPLVWCSASMFSNSDFNANIGSWNVARVANMFNTFSGAAKFRCALFSSP